MKEGFGWFEKMVQQGSAPTFSPSPTYVLQSISTELDSAIIVTGGIGLFFSLFLTGLPAPKFIGLLRRRRIINHEDTALPDILGVLSCGLWIVWIIVFAETDKAIFLFITNLAGALLELIYIGIFFSLANRRRKIIITAQLFGMVMLFSAIFLPFYLRIDSSKGQQFEYLCGTINTLVFLAPLHATVKLIRRRNYDSFSLYSPFAVMIHSVPWIVHGVLLNDNTIMASNIGIFYIGLIDFCLNANFKNVTSRPGQEEPGDVPQEPGDVPHEEQVQEEPGTSRPDDEQRPEEPGTSRPDLEQGPEEPGSGPGTSNPDEEQGLEEPGTSMPKEPLEEEKQG